MKRRFRLVDVFGASPLAGNPLAVVVDSEGLTTEEMLELTRWFDLSETTFLSPPTVEEADYAVRIFTPAGELPFAGHPTLGSGHVWQTFNPGSRDEMIQQCGVGLVGLRRSGDLISFRAPPLLREGQVDESELSRLAEILRVDVDQVVASRWVDNGPGWVGLLLGSADAVLAVEPDFSPRRGSQLDVGIVGLFPEGSEFAYEVRAFFTGSRGEMREDPVTGSLNASVAQWMIDEGRVKPPYLASQGARVGRSGRVSITTDGSGSVWVGGRVYDIVEGSYEG